MAEITIRISDKMLKIAGIVFGGLCLAWVFSYLWSSGLFLSKYNLRMYVSDVSGMGVGATVRLDGIKVGTVDAIRLAGSTANNARRIELVLRVEKRHQDEIRSDSTAALLTEGLLGSRYVSIHRGFRGNPIDPGEEIPVVPVQELTLKNFVEAFSKMVDCSQEEKRSPDGKIAPKAIPSKSQ